MKNKRILFVICCVLLAGFYLGLTGLVHAATDRGAAAGKDRLVGVLITRDYLDLFDVEAFLGDNMAILEKGGEVPENKRAQYQGRLYAAALENPWINEETGESHTDTEYLFEGVDGVRFFAAFTGEGEYKAWGLNIDNAVSDPHFGVNYTDAGTDLQLRATLYLDESRQQELLSEDVFYCINPVYQAEDGSVYATAGDGYSGAGDFTCQISETETVSDGATEAEVKTEVEIQLLWAPGAERVSVLQFSGGHELLEEQVYAAGELPEQMEMRAETQYVSVETETRDAEGCSGLERTIVQRGDESLFADFGRGDGLLIRQSCELLWGAESD